MTAAISLMMYDMWPEMLTVKILPEQRLPFDDVDDAVHAYKQHVLARDHLDLR